MTPTTHDPLVSIVVPAYQAAATIGETLASLAAQTWDRLEVVVVDDGSSDATGDIARSAAARSNGRIRYVRQDNCGQSAALNAGWGQSSGAYLGYLGADDVLYPGCVATLVRILEQRPDLLGVYPDYDLIDAASRVIRRVHAPDFDPRDLVERGICQPGPGALFRRAAFDLTGGWNRGLRQMPDYDFWLRFVRFGTLARVPEPLAGFRVHEDSQTFAAPSATKSEEPPALMRAFLAEASPGQWNQGRAMASAHTLAARLHLRAGRVGPALRHAMSALAQEPAIAVQPRFWRFLASGALGRLRYRLTASTQSSSRQT